MYERMLDKSREPTPAQIRDYVGEDGCLRLERLETTLSDWYELSRELRFPFGNGYGWGYKYSHRSTHLCYVFFEKGAFTVTVQIGDRQVPAMEQALPSLTPKGAELWAGRYPCGEQGGWMHDRVLTDADLADALVFIRIKKAPRARR